MKELGLFELRQQASAARKAREPATALPLFRRIWYEYPLDRTGWDGWGYAWCLYRLSEYAKARLVLEEALELEPELPVLKQQLAWCLYQQELKQDPLPKEAEATARKILALADPHDPMSPFQRTVFRMLDHFAHPFAAEKVLEWLEPLDPNVLSQEPEKFEQADGKIRQLPSPWLRYMGKRTEALLQLGEYASCANWCREILAQPRERVAQAQRIWFERRLARCLLSLAQPDEAVSLYQAMLRRKSEWFLYQELAEALQVAGRFDEALQAAVSAAQAPGEPEKKVRLWLLLADLLDGQGKHHLANRHRLLTFLLRQEQGWSIPPELETLASCQPTLPKIRPLLQELKTCWSGLQPPEASLPLRQASSKPPSHGPGPSRPSVEAGPATGRIDKMLPHGEAGFLRLSTGESVYFRARDFWGEPAQLKPGLKVSCDIRMGFDAKKQRPAPQAILLRPE